MATAQKPVADLTDDEVLARTGYGKFGPAIVGKELHDRAQRILKSTGGGAFGPAITDPNYAKKQAAARRGAVLADDDGYEGPEGTDGGAETSEEEFTGEIDPLNLEDQRNPWSFVTLGGAKMLAQQHMVSYAPKVKRAELIKALQDAKVAPPPLPDHPDAED